MEFWTAYVGVNVWTSVRKGRRCCSPQHNRCRRVYGFRINPCGSIVMQGVGLPRASIAAQRLNGN